MIQIFDNIKNNLNDYKRIINWFVGLFLLFLLALLLAPPVQLPITPLAVGDISPTSIKAPADLSVEDKQTTIQRQEAAASDISPIYDYDPDLNKIYNKIDSLFLVNNQLNEPDWKIIFGIPENKKLSREEKWNLLKSKDIPAVSFSTFNTLQNLEKSEKIQDAAKSLVARVMDKGIVENKDLLQAEKKIISRDIRNNEEINIKDLSRLWDIKQARDFIRNTAVKNSKEDWQVVNAAIEIAQNSLGPNLFFNKSATEASKKEAVENVKPVYYQIKKGEMIVREGEIVRADQVVKLNALSSMRRRNLMPALLSGIVFFLFTLAIFSYIYLNSFHADVIADPNKIYLLTTILVLTFSLSRVFIFFSSALSAYTPQINISAYSYMTPYAIGGLLAAVLVNAQLGIIFSLITGMLAAVQMGNDFVFFLLAAIGGSVAVYSVTHTKQRTVLIKAGLWVGLTNIFIIIPATLMKGKMFTPQLFYEVVGGIIGGMFVATIVSAVLPILESIFKVTTDIKLLELSNMDQPLLKQLALAAPGTYQHSIVVGSLAEAAAESIGANSLLARIAAYYHDIGKINKAEYFIENLINQENKHTKLAPSMSSLIINSHVKEGVELAREYKLPPMIIDIIQQHHGTSLIKFFYQKAKQQENAHLQLVREKEYSYPGPRPQTIEAGIIMMADVLEASSRSLPNPTPQKIEDLVYRAIHDIYNAGQLDECDLTFRNLTHITAAFIRILNSVFHPRIEYPEDDKKERNSNWKSLSGIKPDKKFKPLQ